MNKKPIDDHSSSSTSQWDNNYEQLHQFWKVNGNTEVPFTCRQTTTNVLDDDNDDSKPTKNNNKKSMMTMNEKKTQVSLHSSMKDKPVNLRILAKWAARQRQRYLRGTLLQEQKGLLDNIQFRWTDKLDKLDAIWMIKYNHLVKYNKIHGNTNVPLSDEYNLELGTWVTNQRKLNAKNKLKENRKQLLNDIHFQWNLRNRGNDNNNNNTIQATDNTITTATKTNDRINTNDNYKLTLYDSKWYETYLTLVKYYKEYGHCNVPYVYPINPSLALWVSSQRRSYYQKWWDNDIIMKQYRIDLLNKIHFKWKITIDDVNEELTTKMNHANSREVDDDDNDKIDYEDHKKYATMNDDITNNNNDKKKIKSLKNSIEKKRKNEKKIYKVDDDDYVDHDGNHNDTNYAPMKDNNITNDNDDTKRKSYLQKKDDKKKKKIKTTAV